MYKYFPHTEDDLQAMLAAAGVKCLDELYAQPLAMSEMEVRQLLRSLVSRTVS